MVRSLRWQMREDATLIAVSGGHLLISPTTVPVPGGG
jgi:hypothetical protein